MTRVYVPIDMLVAERAGIDIEEPGLIKVANGLGRMKAWCSQNTPGWGYSRTTFKFRFECRAHADSFRVAFRDAFGYE